MNSLRYIFVGCFVYFAAAGAASGQKMTAAEAVALSQPIAMQYSEDAKLVAINFIDSDILGIDNPILDLDSGKANCWICMYYSPKKDSAASISVYGDGDSVSVKDAGRFTAPDELKYGLIKNWLDSPAIIQKAYLGVAGSYRNDKPNVHVASMGINGSFWYISFASDVDTLFVLLEAISGNIVYSDQSPVGIDPVPEQHFAAGPLYPNPVSLTSGAVSMVLASPKAGPVHVAIIDLAGRMSGRMRDYDVRPGTNTINSLLPSALEPGTYFMVVIGDGFTVTRPFIVTR